MIFKIIVARARPSIAQMGPGLATPLVTFDVHIMFDFLFLILGLPCANKISRAVLKPRGIRTK